MDAGLDAGMPIQPTLSSIQANVFTLTCATSGCHTGASVIATDGLDLSPGNSYASLVGVDSHQQTNLKRVAPGDPTNSFLVIKLQAPSCCYSTGGTCSMCQSWESMGTGDGYGYYMPEVGAPLRSDQIQAIQDWITMGAQDN